MTIITFLHFVELLLKEISSFFLHNLIFLLMKILVNILRVSIRERKNILQINCNNKNVLVDRMFLFHQSHLLLYIPLLPGRACQLLHEEDRIIYTCVYKGRNIHGERRYKTTEGNRQLKMGVCLKEIV